MKAQSPSIYVSYETGKGDIEKKRHVSKGGEKVRKIERIMEYT